MKKGTEECKISQDKREIKKSIAILCNENSNNKNINYRNNKSYKIPRNNLNRNVESLNKMC